MSILTTLLILISFCLCDTAFTPIQEACIASVTITGFRFCRATSSSFTEYDNLETYCTDPEVSGYDTLEYFKVAPFTSCNESTSQCYNLESLAEGDEKYTVKDINLGENSISCVINVGEYCYRNANNDSDLANIYSNSTTEYHEDLPQCCMIECQHKYVAPYGGCASNLTFYDDVNTFCTAYCNNRSLSIIQCGSSNEDINCIDHQECPSHCILNAPTQHVCGDNNVLYTSADDLCQALEISAITEYFTCQGDCTIDDCTIRECMNYLKNVNYTTETICGDSGNFYNNQQEYCIAYNQGIESIFLLCDQQACTSKDDCCIKKCEMSHPDSSTYCTNTFNFFDNRDDFCVFLCTDDSVTEHLCNGKHCDGKQCCESGCKNNIHHIACNITTGKLFEANEYCFNECANENQPILENCNDNDTPIDCSEAECEYKQCLSVKSQVYNPDEKICGETGEFYNTIEDFCNEIKNASETGDILCNGNSCADDKACCKAHCVNVTFKDEYIARCNSENFDIYNTAVAYCDAYCDSDSLTVAMCPEDSITPCSKSQCCSLQCESHDGYDVCDNEFNVVIGVDNCKKSCNGEKPGISHCGDSDCTQYDCDVKACLVNMESYNGDGVCSVSNEAMEYFESKTVFCEASVHNQNVTPHACLKDSCSSKLDCEISLCIESAPLVGPVCGTNNNWYTQQIEFCTDKLTNDVSVKICENNLGLDLPCNENQCCFEKCKEEQLLDACNVETYVIETSIRRCEFRCNGDVVGRADLIVDECYNDLDEKIHCTDCRKFKCEDQIQSYEHDKICLFTKEKQPAFYNSKEEYCDRLIENDMHSFIPSRAISCKDGENVVPCETEFGCCFDSCIRREANLYKNTCKHGENIVIDLVGYCNSHCSDVDIIVERCDGDCTVNDCEIKQCSTSLQSHYSTICLIDDFEGVYFFQNKMEYCSEAVAREGQVEYDISDMEIGCAGRDGIKACRDVEDCCMNKCLTESYVDGCNNETYQLVNHEDFCAHRCSGANTDRINLSIENCYNDNSEIVPCQSCATLACAKAVSAYKFVTICLNKNYEGFFYASHSSYCEDKIENNKTDYAVDYDLACNNDACNDARDCCHEACLTNPDFTAGCDTQTNNFVDQQSFCDLKCESNAPKLHYCKDEICTSRHCEIKKCLWNSNPTFTKICILNGIDGRHFFETREAYCEAKVEIQETDYDNLHEIFCKNDGKCENADACCYHECLSRYDFNACSATDYNLMTPSQVCAHKCDPSSVIAFEEAVIECTDGSHVQSCIQQDCDIFKCIETLTPVYKNKHVCDKNDLFYGPVDEFCALKLGDMNKAMLCNEEPCHNDTNCCLANCNTQNNYQPRCDGIEFNFISTQSEYCNVFCTNNRIFPTYYLGGHVANEDECCFKRCEKQGNFGDAVCDGQTFELISGVDNCLNFCAEISTIIVCEKEGGCTQGDCDISKCIHNLEQSVYIGQKVCGDDEILYDNFINYCEAKLSNEEIKIVYCDAQGCDDDKECCIGNCKQQFGDEFIPLCDLSYNPFNNAHEYCVSYCENNKTFTPLTCGDHNCTKTECCEEECNNSPYNNVCSASPESVLVSQADYCHNNCNNKNYAHEISRCGEENCTVDDCAYFDCVQKISLPFESYPVCGENAVLYANASEYCHNVRNNNIDYFFLCGGYEICDTQAECCNQACPNNYSDNFDGRCNNKLEWIDNSLDYCDEFCDEENAYSGDLMCEHRLCNKEECCHKKCMGEEYEGYCSQNGQLLAKSDYCSAHCSDNEPTYVTCEGGCTEEDCTLSTCMNSLSDYPYNTICTLDSDHQNPKNVLFFESKQAYCDYINIEDDYEYNPNDIILCGNDDIQCSDSLECCKRKCLNDISFNMCHQFEFYIITPENFCNDLCGDNDPQALPAINCMQGDNVVNCSDCYKHKCESDMEKYPFNPICGFVSNESINYTSIDDFCNTAIASGYTEDFYYNSQVCIYDGNQSACNNDADCCKAFCKGLIGFQDKCNINDYTLYTLNHYCDDYCHGSITDTVSCGYGCTQTTCNYERCVTEAGVDANYRICLKEARDFYFYFTNVDYFCEAEVLRQTPSYDLSQEDALVLCGDVECDNINACCYERCLLEITHATCSTPEFEIVRPDKYCNYRCNNTDFFSGNYTNMSVYLCSDGNVQIDCTVEECNKQDCLSVSSLIYGQNPVCAINYQLYDDVNEYCDANLETGVKSFTCSGSPCLTTDRCCLEVCIQTNIENFTGVCSTTELIFRDDVVYFCEEFCRNGNTFVVHQIDDINATKVECCSAKCVRDDDQDRVVCSLSDYEIVSSEELCNDFCTEDSPGYHQCDGDCTQAQCNIAECVHNNGGAAGFDYCVRNGDHYADSKALCEATSPEFEFTLIDCNSNNCTSINDCCIVNCKLDNSTFTEGCSTTYHLFENVDQYCTAHCENSVTLLECELGNCNLNECCNEKCNNDETWQVVCSPTPNSALLNQPTYCSSYCTNDTYEETVHHCEGDCQAADCEKQNCNYEVNIVFDSEGPICGSDGNQYLSISDFCDAQHTNVDQDLKFALCGDSKICESAEECCITACLLRNDTYSPRCNSHYQWLPTVSDYCGSFCANEDHSDLLCGENPTDYCNEVQCCAQNCTNLTYVPVCNEAFEVLTQSGYCNLNCSGEFQPVFCDEGCDETKCNIEKCKQDNITYAAKGICLQSTILNENYYADLISYCVAAINTPDFDVLIDEDNYISCDSATGCLSSQDCCSLTCLFNNPHNKCLNDTHDLITSEDYCNAVCRNDAPITNICRDIVDKEINCENCNYFKCQAELNNYPFDQVCQYQSTVFALINSVDEFCTSISVTVAENFYDYIAFCKENDNNVECGNSDNCCYASCLANNTNYLNTCKTADLTVFYEEDYCTALCQNEMISTVGCGNESCDVDACEIKKCIILAGNNHEHICLLERKVNRFYFENVEDYCKSQVQAEKTIYNILDHEEINNETNSIDSAISCCVERCLRESYNKGCQVQSQTLYTHRQFCDDRCSNNNPETVDPTDADLRNCFDGNDQRDCSDLDCAVFYCEYIFSEALYDSSAICLSKGSEIPDTGLEYFYADVNQYCYTLFENDLNTVDILSNHLSCNGGICDNKQKCCIGRCLTESFTTGCNQNYELIDQNTYCAAVCASSETGLIEISLDYCDGNCTTCSQLACLDDLESYNLSTICLTNPLDTTHYFESKDAYCTAKNAPGTPVADYSLSVDDYLICGEEACNRDLCCVQICENVTFYNVCTASFEIYTDDTRFCTDSCAGNLTGVNKCFTNDPEPVQRDCELNDCCVLATDAENNDDRICGSNGISYESAEAFCAAKLAPENSDSLTVHICADGCSESECFMDYCLKLAENTAVNTPFCGSDHNLYNNLNDFCTAQFSTIDLQIDDETCAGDTCTQSICCVASCNEGAPVVVGDKDDYMIVPNECTAICNSQMVLYRCQEGTIEACDDEFSSYCADYCNENAPTEGSTYCGATEGFYNSNDYCLLFLCPFGPNYNTFEAHNDCLDNGCTSTECNIAQCIAVNCVNVTTDQICAASGSVFDNDCIRQCNNDFSVSLCSEFDNPIGCQAECRFLSCEVSLTDENDIKVCGDDNNLYDNSCYATRAGQDVRFVCPADCSGNVRVHRCGFDCRNGRTFVADEL